MFGIEGIEPMEFRPGILGGEAPRSQRPAVAQKPIVSARSGGNWRGSPAGGEIDQAESARFRQGENRKIPACGVWCVR